MNDDMMTTLKNEIKRYRDNPAKYLSELMGVKLSLWQKIWFTSYCKYLITKEKRNDKNKNC